MAVKERIGERYRVTALDRPAIIAIIWREPADNESTAFNWAV
jgi:hypothetical protein